MDANTLLLFSATVLPLVCTPGPDIIFVASQTISGGPRAGFRSTAGIILGYCVHSFAVAAGLAAVLATAPILFEAIKWLGIGYLVYLAYKLMRAALHPSGPAVGGIRAKNPLWQGFWTSLLNPKGMMMYVAIIPQFINPHSDDRALQAFLLSAVFMFWCTVIYSAVCMALTRRKGRELTDAKRRLIDGTAGGMLLMAAGFLAAIH